MKMNLRGQTAKKKKSKILKMDLVKKPQRNFKCKIHDFSMTQWQMGPKLNLHRLDLQLSIKAVVEAENPEKKKLFCLLFRPSLNQVALIFLFHTVQLWFSAAVWGCQPLQKPTHTVLEASTPKTTFFNSRLLDLLFRNPNHSIRAALITKAEFQHRRLDGQTPTHRARNPPAPYLQLQYTNINRLKAAASSP